MNLTFSILGAILVSQLPQPSLFPAVPWEKHLPLSGSWGWRTPPPCHPDDRIRWSVLLWFSLDLSSQGQPRVFNFKFPLWRGFAESWETLGGMEVTAIRLYFPTVRDELPAALEEPPKGNQLYVPSSFQNLTKPHIVWFWTSSDCLALPLPSHGGLCSPSTLDQAQLLALPVLGSAQGFTASCKWLLRKLSPRQAPQDYLIHGSWVLQTETPFITASCHVTVQNLSSSPGISQNYLDGNQQVLLGFCRKCASF